jgi:hypothetical protein
MDLDDLTDMIEGKGTKKQIFAGDSGADSDDESPDEVKAVSHLIDDDEQEESDLEAEIVDDSEDESDDESDGSDIDEYNFESNDIAEGEEENDSDDEDDEGNDEGDEDEEEVGQDDADADIEDEDDDKDDDEDDRENENGGDSDEDEDGDLSSHTYQPTKGEDIYGRLTDDSSLEKASGGKYVPPARRAQLLATIDEVRTLHYTFKH